jgi:hypothetical protein
VSLSEWLGILGLVVSVVGFGVTIWQLVRTANASEATSKALKAATERMNINHLLVLLPQLKTYEAELDGAIADEDRRTASRTLVSYSHVATQIAMLLELNADERSAELVKTLRDSAKACSNAKAVLVSGSSKSLGTVMKPALAQIGEVSATAAGLMTEFQIKVS